MEKDGTILDVAIIGAGISGINAAYRLQTKLPGSTYAIFEARGNMGGTWDLFRYPGIRSDSDLHTFGFSWRPWKQANPIATGDSIVTYMQETASMYGIDKNIKYRHRIQAADWSSKRQAWDLTVDADGEAQHVQAQHVQARFLIMGTGYYDYDQPLETTIPGIENFKGTVVHPQFWPEDFDYSGKKLVIIGSGATAVTLLPSLAEKAARVTMLQRSPSYILSLPNRGGVNSWVRRLWPASVLHQYDRLKFLTISYLFFQFCRAFPSLAKRMLLSATIKQLPKDVSHNPHFMPSYNPWEQRLCLCPDGDFYKCLHNGKAEVVTDHIQTVTEDGILLQSGQRLEADIIVTATGLKIQVEKFPVSVDGQRIRVSDKFFWRSAMLQDVPNLMYIIGYANASWTLGADATAVLACRILQHMRSRGFSSATPRAEHPEKMKTLPVLDLKSTYIQRAKETLPKASDVGPWQPRYSYFADMFKTKYGDVTDGLQFSAGI